MRVAPILNRTTEVRRVAMARILDRQPSAILVDAPARDRAYTAAGIAPVTRDDDAEAVRRSIIFRFMAAPRPAAVIP